MQLATNHPPAHFTPTGEWVVIKSHYLPQIHDEKGYFVRQSRFLIWKWLVWDTLLYAKRFASYSAAEEHTTGMGLDRMNSACLPVHTNREDAK